MLEGRHLLEGGAYFNMNNQRYALIRGEALI